MTQTPAALDALPGPWIEASTGLPPGGPRMWWRGPAGVAIAGPPARVAQERAGLARLAGHPAAPVLVGEAEDCLVFAPLGEAPEDPVAVVGGWPRGVRWGVTLSLGEALAALPGRTDPTRALARLDLKRRQIDRALNHRFAVQTYLGLGLGGVFGGWLREQGAAVVCLRLSGVATDSWFAQDLAATGLMADAVEEARELHRAGLDPKQADAAFDVALLRFALDELVLSGETRFAEAALLAFQALSPNPPPAEVRLSLRGAPDWLDVRRWIPADGLVPASHARALLHNLDGLVVGENRLCLECEPPIRRGHAPQPREPRLTRQRRLFSRWSQGILADDEGLISATPEALALELAEGLSGSVLDPTAGIGAISIALARNPRVTGVTAMDLDAGRLAMARHNAAVYGVADRITWICGDSLAFNRSRKFDALVVDPPWGGRDYDREGVSLSDLPFDLAGLLLAGPERARVKLPRSFRTSTLESAVPGPWRWRAAVDERGVIKFVVGERG